MSCLPNEASTLHNALETLGDPSHVRMLPQSVLFTMLQAAQLEVATTVRWTTTREFGEWLRLINAPARSESLRAVMRAFAQAGIEAEVGLCITAHKPSS